MYLGPPGIDEGEGNSHSVNKLLERLAKLGVRHGQLPFIHVRADEGVHLCVEVGADSKLVLENNPTKFLRRHTTSEYI